jgi:hypothetical protein
VEYTGYEIFS